LGDGQLGTKTPYRLVDVVLFHFYGLAKPFDAIIQGLVDDYLADRGLDGLADGGVEVGVGVKV
jgi:hypothetical protein